LNRTTIIIVNEICKGVENLEFQGQQQSSALRNARSDTLIHCLNTWKCNIVIHIQTDGVISPDRMKIKSL